MQRQGFCRKQVRPIINSVSMLHTCKLLVVLSVSCWLWNIICGGGQYQPRFVSLINTANPTNRVFSPFCQTNSIPAYLIPPVILDIHFCCKSKFSDFLEVVFERVLTSKAFEEDCDALEPPQAMAATPSAPSSLLNSFRLPFLFTVFSRLRALTGGKFEGCADKPPENLQVICMPFLHVSTLEAKVSRQSFAGERGCGRSNC